MDAFEGTCKQNTLLKGLITRNGRIQMPNKCNIEKATGTVQGKGLGAISIARRKVGPIG